MDIREIAKKYPGVTFRGNSIQIAFSYEGVRCRETLSIVPTKASLKTAFDMLQGIKWDIVKGTFNYPGTFPDSRNSLKLSKTPGRVITIENALKDWYKHNCKRWQPSTRRDYEQSIWSKLIPAFGTLALTEITSNTVKDWINLQTVTNKRINNTLIPLRQTFDEAFCDGLIDVNPMARIKNLPIQTREPNPFNQKEIEMILGYLQGQERNYFQFAFWSGLRTSELIALRWEDVDFDNDRLYVRIAVVLGKQKTTKTNSGQRTVELQPQAREALLSQHIFSGRCEKVFLNPRSNSPWKSDQPLRRLVWIPALQNLGIPYRNPYQTRHTFASMMLNRGENPMWVAQQMGHKDWGMIRRVYGRWIPNY